METIPGRWNFNILNQPTDSMRGAWMVLVTTASVERVISALIVPDFILQTWPFRSVRREMGRGGGGGGEFGHAKNQEEEVTKECDRIISICRKEKSKEERQGDDE
jgi:hypothetical protein